MDYRVMKMGSVWLAGKKTLHCKKANGRPYMSTAMYSKSSQRSNRNPTYARHYVTHKKSSGKPEKITPDSRKRRGMTIWYHAGDGWM